MIDPRPSDPKSLVQGTAWANDERSSVDVIYFFGRMKIALGIVGIILLFFLVESVMTSEFVQARLLGLFGFGLIWGDNEMVRKTFQACLDGAMFYDVCGSDLTISRYLLARWKNDLGDTSYLLMCLLPLLIFVFWRRPAPIRFNPELGAMYSWRRGRLFIHPSRNFSYKEFVFFDLMAGSKYRQPASILLKDSRNPKREATFRVGPYVSKFEHQPARILDQMKIVLSETQSEKPWVRDARPHKLSHPFWEWSLLGPRKLPVDIDERARTWLTEAWKNSA